MGHWVGVDVAYGQGSMDSCHTVEKILEDECMVESYHTYSHTLEPEHTQMEWGVTHGRGKVEEILPCAYHNIREGHDSTEVASKQDVLLGNRLGMGIGRVEGTLVSGCLHLHQYPVGASFFLLAT